MISPVSLAMLTGAGLKNVVDADNSGKNYIYQPVQFDLPIMADEDGNGVVRIDWDTAQDAHDIYYSENKGQIFGTVLDNAGAGVYFLSLAVDGIKMYHKDGTVKKGPDGKDYVGECVPGDTDAGHVFTISASERDYLELKFEGAEKYIGNTLRVDCYCQRSSGATQITIDAENFAGDFYVEASTLFRDQYTKKDMPAVFVIPDAKIQSNFTFTMANSGDPSSFAFTMDAFPDYTKFDRTKKVFCAIQIMGDENVVPQTDNVKDDTCPAIDPEVAITLNSAYDDGKGVTAAKLGRNLRIESARGNFDFFGTLNPVANWDTYKEAVKTYLGEEAAKDETKNALELTGYYFPVTIDVQSPAGTSVAGGTIAFASPKTGRTLTSAATVTAGDKATATMLIPVDADNSVYEVTVSGNSKTSTYTFDFSKCVFK